MKTKKPTTKYLLYELMYSETSDLVRGYLLGTYNTLKEAKEDSGMKGDLAIYEFDVKGKRSRQVFLYWGEEEDSRKGSWEKGRPRNGSQMN